MLKKPGFRQKKSGKNHRFGADWIQSRGIAGALANIAKSQLKIHEGS
jgi:ribosomal protein L32E